MLELKNVTISHNGTTLVDHLSFCAEKGEITTICGPSGCGKTTLIRAMMGFHPVDKGFITVNGELLTPLSAPAFRKFMAYVPQDLSFPVDTVAELASMPFTLQANSTIAISRESITEQWKDLALDSSLYDKLANEISGGERQQVIIASLSLLNKSIVIVDEPTSALDQESSKLVANFLHRLAQKGSAVIVVTHNPDFYSDKKITWTLQ